jgi:hypothetical protein
MASGLDTPDEHELLDHRVLLNHRGRSRFDR